MADIDKNKYIGSFSLNQKVSLKTYNCNKLNVQIIFNQSSGPHTEKNLWQSVNYKENYEVLII